ncbi:MAG TPA: hypothetical protein VF818_04930 [Ktedonobacterales bacterium]
MSEHAPTRTPLSAILDDWLNRAQMWSAALAAIALSAVILGNVLLLGLGMTSAFWLVAIVQLGPPASVLLANVSTATGYYGTWRTLIGKVEYEASDDLKKEALSAPGRLSGAPQALARRLGCRSAISGALLAASLAVFALTQAPPPFRVLGAGASAFTSLPSRGSQPSSTPVTTVGSATTPTDMLSPTDTPVPTPTPFVSVAVSPLSNAQSCVNSPLPPLTITIDNTQSTVGVAWSLTIPDVVLATKAPWATANQMSGILPAGQFTSFTLTPAPGTSGVCSERQTTTYHAQVNIWNSSSFVISDAVTAYVLIA